MMRRNVIAVLTVGALLGLAAAVRAQDVGSETAPPPKLGTFDRMPSDEEILGPEDLGLQKSKPLAGEGEGAEAAAEEARWYAGLIYTYILDYSMDHADAFDSIQKTSNGSMYGFFFGQARMKQHWRVTVNYAPDVTLEGEAGFLSTLPAGTPYDVKMTRFDSDFEFTIPWEGFSGESWGTIAGVKFVYAKKDFSAAGMSWFKQTSYYVGPTFGGYYNTPIGGKESPVSLFVTGNFMLLFVSQKREDGDLAKTVPPATADDTLTPELSNVGMGLNGTIGLAWSPTNATRVVLGYRGQWLSNFNFDQYDFYHGPIVSGEIRF